MINEMTVTVAGNLTRDPERKVSHASGKPFAVVPIAVNRRRFDAGQEAWITEDTTYVDLQCFRGTGATALASFRKGDPVLAHGKLALREWKAGDASGTRVSVTVDSIGHDVTFGVSSFTRGKVAYDPDPTSAHDQAPPEHGGGGVVGALEERTGGPAASSEEVPDGEVPDAEIATDADGVVQDDQQADAALARSA